MRVEFNYSQEDIVDASMRFTSRSRTVRLLRLRRSIWGSLFAFGVVLVLFRFTLKGVIGGLLAASIGMAIDPPLHRYQLRKNLRKVFREMYGTENQFTCEVELTPEVLKTKSREGESSTDWARVEEVVSTSDSVDIFARSSGVVVRNRAFASAEERQRFIDLARAYLSQARA